MIWLLLYYIYPFLNRNSELNPVKSPIGKGKAWKLWIYFFFWLCERVLKLVTKCTIKCYCGYYNLCLEFLFIHRFSFFGVILCLRVFSSAISFLKFKTCLVKYFQEIIVLDVPLLEVLKWFYCRIWDRW